MRHTRFRSAVTPQDQITYRRLMARLALIYGSLALGMMLFVLLHQRPESNQPDASAAAGEFSAASIPRDQYDR